MINWMKEAQEREQDIVNTLSDWIKINSVHDETTAGPGMPFGKGIQEAMEFILEQGKKDGFKTVNDEGYACHLDYGDGEEIFGILGHVDVVPEGDDWTYPPFSGKVVDRKMYGRGTQDDKGPVIAAYYAVKIIQDLGLPISKKIRIILGGNEERDWKCVDHYFKNFPRPDLGFTPDGDFPIVFGEKEIKIVSYTGEYASDTVVSFEGGTAANSVPDYAKAVVTINNAEIKQTFATFLADKKLEGTVSEVDGNLQFEIFGISAHGSTPEIGVNAAVALLTFLAKVTDNKMVAHFSNIFSHYDGSGLGINFTGDKMGSLTANLGIIEYKDNAFKFILDIRYPLENDKADMEAKITKSAENPNFSATATEIAFKKGIYLDIDSPLIKTLHKAYIDFTGDTKTKPIVLGGGTYARATDNIVCFGMLFPESTNSMHQKDEAVDLDELIKATAIYAQAIYDLVK